MEATAPHGMITSPTCCWLSIWQGARVLLYMARASSASRPAHPKACQLPWQGAERNSLREEAGRPGCWSQYAYCESKNHVDAKVAWEPWVPACKIARVLACSLACGTCRNTRWARFARMLIGRARMSHSSALARMLIASLIGARLLARASKYTSSWRSNVLLQVEKIPWNHRATL